jgi:hypothetical protein
MEFRTHRSVSSFGRRAAHLQAAVSVDRVLQCCRGLQGAPRTQAAEG